MQDFRNLDVWAKSHQLVLAIYRLTNQFPTEERYGLTSQVRRAAVSIAANTAEGCGRQSDSDFKRMLHIAMGSACELEYHLILCHDLAVISQDETNASLLEIASIKRMLAALINRLKVAESRQSKLTADS